MTTVKWIPFSNGNPEDGRNQWMQILVEEPPSLLQELAKTKKTSPFFPCPAFVDYCKNTFVIRSPVDLHVQIRRNPYWVGMEDKDQLFFDSYISLKTPADEKNGLLSLTMPPWLLFYTEDSQPVMIEAMPAFLSHVPRLHGLSLIPGRFDISKWVRPVNYTVEVAQEITEIRIKEGDVLFYVRFTAEDGSLIKLERGELTSGLYKAVSACIGVKTVSNNKKLPELYQRAAAMMSQWVKKL